MWFGFHPDASTAVNPRFSGIRPAASRLPTASDQVTFSAKTKLAMHALPTEYPILLIPGLFAPVRSVNGARTYFREAGHPVVKSVKVPFIASGQDLDRSAWWLADMADDVRIRVGRIKLAELEGKLAKVSGSVKKTEVARRFFGLENTEEGRLLAQAMLGLLPELSTILKEVKAPYLIEGPRRLGEIPGHLLKDIDGLGPGIAFKLFQNGLQITKAIRMNVISRIAGMEISDTFTFLNHLFNAKDDSLRLSTRLIPVRKRMIEAVPTSYTPEDRLKIANRLLDKLAPRVILMGHSMGGVASTKLVQMPLDPDSDYAGADVGMVVAMGSPVNGAERPPDSLPVFKRMVREAPLHEWIAPLFEKYLEGIVQMLRGSPVVEKIQTLGAPSDTTVISIATPEDGLVSLEGARLPESFDNMHNLEVTPQTSRLTRALYPKGHLLINEPLDYFLQLSADYSRELQGLLRHCVFIDNVDTHWSDKGEITRQFLAEIGEPDRLKRLLHSKNFEGLREHILDLLILRTSTDPIAHARHQKLIPMLRQIKSESLPFTDSVDKKATKLLEILIK